MASAADIRKLAALIADAADSAAALLGERHPIAVKLLDALKETARTLEAAKRLTVS
jgi:hypothetical protein